MEYPDSLWEEVKCSWYEISELCILYKLRNGSEEITACLTRGLVERLISTVLR